MNLGKIQKYIHPFIDFCLTANDNFYSFDLHPLTSLKKLNYNSYDEGTEYSWHIDAVPRDPVRDIKLTALLNLSEENYIVIYPNNDSGSDLIINSFKKNFKTNSKIKIFPSLRFEHFLTLLKNSNFIIGNSSAGICEAPFYGIPTVNIGSRQNNRSSNKQIINVDHKKDKILKAIDQAKNLQIKKIIDFGSGGSSKKFVKVLNSGKVWSVNIQKFFNDLN